MPYLLVLSCVILPVLTFNMAPEHPQIFTDPTGNTDSYFGFSVALLEGTKSRLVVGAPRGYPAAFSSVNATRPGIIYFCSVDSNSPCEQVLPGKPEDFLELSNTEDVFLGASLDVEHNGSGLVVCAPRWSDWFNDTRCSDAGCLLGLCYFMKDAWKEKDVERLNQKIDNNDFVIQNGTRRFMIHRQAGISVHFVQNGQEVLMGATGIDRGNGGILRFQDTNNEHVTAVLYAYRNQRRVTDNYFGYSVGSGKFRKDKILYVGSAPRSAAYKGKIDCNRNLVEAVCTCKAGLSGRCKHIAALCAYINSERQQSQTSVLQQWHAPKSSIQKELYSKGECITEIFHTAQDLTHSHQNTSRPKSEINESELYNKIKNIDCAFSAILKAECEGENIAICESMVNIIVNNAVIVSENEGLKVIINELDTQNDQNIHKCYFIQRLSDLKTKLVPVNYVHNLPKGVQQFYETHVKISKTQKIQIAMFTKSQSQCKRWHEERNIRISASIKPHKFKTLKTGMYEQLAKSFMMIKGINTPAIKYGRSKEETAIAEYCDVYKCSVKHVGLFIHENQPWLCCSPDGIVEGPEGLKLLEIKCPFSCAEKPIMNGNMCNVPYLLLSPLGDIILKESHIYYTQIQVSLYVLNLRSCDLFVYTGSSLGSVNVNVQRNEQFLAQVIPTLERFYFEHYITLLYRLHVQRLPIQ